MTTNSDEIRNDIENTREELSYDVDALADKVRPSSIVHRQTDKAKGALRRARERVMGVASDVGDNVSSAGETIADAPRAVARQAQGNPLAVGLISFGVGLLAASLIPASRKEQELGQAVKEKAEPLMQEASGVAQEMGEHLKEPAKEAFESVKATATEGAERVKEEGADATETLKADAQGTTSSDEPRLT